MSASQMQTEHRGPLARIARWAAGHRKTVLVAWLVALVAVLGVSSTGQIAFAAVNFDQRGFDVSKADAQRVIDVARSADSPRLEVELGGQAIQQAEQQGLGTATAVGLLAAVVILLITFGSLVSM